MLSRMGACSPSSGCKHVADTQRSEERKLPRASMNCNAPLWLGKQRLQIRHMSSLQQAHDH
eukprot:6621045-Alexandrium_andersonii.AAC.1